MTKVDHTTRSLAMESSTVSSTGAITPRSDSGTSFSLDPTLKNPIQIQGRSEDRIPVGSSADRAIPSIEEDLDSSSDDNYTTSTPPPSANARGKAAVHERLGTASIDACLENMRISSPDSILGMHDVAAALDGVASGSGTKAVLLEPTYPSKEGSPSNGRAARRRSSSRTNIIPHDVRDEEPPQDRFHEPAFQQAFGDAKILMSELANVLGSSSLHIDPDSTMQRLHREAVKLANFQCPSSRTVGFVGDSGVGKSSLLNSLLDCRGLARTSNSGEACTCVVTEYHYHDDENFAVEIEWFSMEELTSQITELLRSYRHYHLHHIDMDSNEKKDFEERANLAQDTFRAMFRGRLDNDKFLIDEPEDSALGTLRSWLQATDHSSIGGREVRLTLSDCSAFLMRLTSEQTSARESAVWPYVRKVKVFLKAHILKTGLVLVDLPGLRDLNSARRNITERYLLQCDEIFAICYIGRATTDAGVMSVFDLARQANLSNVGIIATRSDDIQAEEAKKDWKGQKAADIQRRIDTVARDRLELDNLKAQLAEFVDDDDLSEGEREEERELGRRSRRVSALMDQHAFELKQYLITTRNTSVTEKLNDLYGRSVSGGGLRVFCVSNMDYWEHRDSPRDEALPLLQLSGIIGVRRYCISIVANSQLRIAVKYIRDSIPALLGDIALWVQSGAGSVSAERKEAIRETLNTLEANLRRDLTGSSSQVNGIARSIKQNFRTELYDRARIYDWSCSARNVAQGWSRWHHATYAAFCLQYGHYSTPAVGFHNWNEEAIEKMVGDLAAPWQNFRSTLQSRHESTRVSIEDLIDWAIQYLDTELHNVSDSTATLNQVLALRQNLLLSNIEEVCEKFEAGLSTLRTDALSGIRSSLIGQAMEDSYQACNNESGRGSDSRRKQIINDKLSRESIFENLMKNFRNKFTILADSLQSDIEVAVATHLDVIRETLDIVRNENAASESEQDPEFRGRVQAEVQTAQDGVRRLQVGIGL